MKFLQTYKRLDNLCRDMNGIGVTGYLEDMEQLPGGASVIPGWKEAYDQLKRYRHLRDQIVHEVNAEEEDLCSAADVAWLEAFYGRILASNDPLALCRKAGTTPSCPDPRLLYRMGAAPHTGCALWLLFAFCIALFFLSEFVFR